MKKRILRIVTVTIILLFVAVGGLLGYVKVVLPDVSDAPEIKVETSEETVERGRYLANNVMVCMDCHGARDWTKFSGPLKPGSQGAGGEVFNQAFGFPGSFTSKNITPHNLQNWTDGEIFRAITCGVNKDGEAFFPVMPYKYYGQLDGEDIKAVIAYLRTLAPVASEVAPSVPDFPFNFIINTIPEDAKLQPRPDKSKVVEYGKYITTAAACMECHTKQEKGEQVGKQFAGGFEFNLGYATVRSPNITPHETGIGNWTRDQFIQRFKMYADSSYVSPVVDMAKGDFQTVMPWTMYAGMTEEDLSAIYDYLRTVEAVDSKIVRFTPAKQ